ncbi:rhodanese-like domain-containing protein [Candidatus Dependentiae bacterium]|nr:rhodanese-like domain-containing protein [Candidatus Dependentiae bacterium]
MTHQKPSNLSQAHTISAQELKNKLDTQPDMIVINVLNQETYVDCHITGSINIPLNQLLETIASWDKDKDIVVYCAQNSCNASDKALQLLQEMGFLHVFLYQGGMKDWFKKNFDTTGTCTMKYLHE